MKNRHVIFLGAGASVNSGYPTGEKLRLRLSSLEHFKRDLEENGIQTTGAPAEYICGSRCLEHFGEFAESIELFRYGGFGTVDEFSKSASLNYPDGVQDMKRLMRLAFCFHNPEEKFHESDYYPFLQRLFKDDLCSLRGELTVLSYNYDCYLDYLLLRAYRRRRMSSGNSMPNDDLKNTLTSGFFDPTLTSWTQPERFRYLKLHGSIAYAEGKTFSHEQLFNSDVMKRFPIPGQGYKKSDVPPIVFPWEVFDADGNFISKDDFIFSKQAQTQQQHSEAAMLFNLYKEIWTAAREAIQFATTISFVGLSMHPYMEQGLKFLFQGKKGLANAIIANNTEDMEAFRRNVSVLLRKVAPDMEARGSWIDDVAIRGDNFGVKKYQAYGLTPRKSFREFIERDMT
jgi:hypothetical protein